MYLYIRVHTVIYECIFAFARFYEVVYGMVMYVIGERKISFVLHEPECDNEESGGASNVAALGGAAAFTNQVRKFPTNAFWWLVVGT